MRVNSHQSGYGGNTAMKGRQKTPEKARKTRTLLQRCGAAGRALTLRRTFLFSFGAACYARAGTHEAGCTLLWETVR